MSEFELEYYEIKEKYENLEKEFLSYKNTSEEFELELENQNKILSDQVNTLSKEISNLRNDVKKLKEKNLEKLKEIELYEKDIEKQKHLVEKLTEEKSKLEKRIVLLENDNSDYMNKIRELECWSEELRRKLDVTLEENIVQNNEFEMYKLETEETIQRFKEELEDAKNEITSKETIIERMTEQRDNLLKTTSCDENESNHENYNNKFIKSCRSYKHVNKMRNSTGDILFPSRFTLFESKIKTPLRNIDEKIQNKFMQSYSKSCLEIEIMEQDVEKEREKEIGSEKEKGIVSFENENEKEVEKKIINSNNEKEIENENKNENLQNEKLIYNLDSDKVELEKEKTNKEKEGHYIENKNILDLTLEVKSEYASVNVTPNPNKRANKDPHVDVDDIILNSIAEKTRKSYIYSNSQTPGNIPTPLNLNTPTKEKDKENASHLHFNFRSNLTWNENVEDEKEFIRNKIEMEIQNILDNRKVFMQQALIQENFSFDFISIKINSNLIQSPNKNLKNMNKEKLLKNIDDMLSKIQERKEKIISTKKLINSKIDKIGLKIF